MTMPMPLATTAATVFGIDPYREYVRQKVVPPRLTPLPLFIHNRGCKPKILTIYHIIDTIWIPLIAFSNKSVARLHLLPQKPSFLSLLHNICRSCESQSPVEKPDRQIAYLHGPKKPVPSSKNGSRNDSAEALGGREGEIAYRVS